MKPISTHLQKIASTTVSQETLYRHNNGKRPGQVAEAHKKELAGITERFRLEKIDQQKKMTEAILQAEERERTHLGHELHDNVNQVLTTAKLYLDMINPGNRKETIIIEKAKEFIAGAINEIRDISKDMVAPGLKEKTLTGSIREVLADLEITGLYHISFIENGADRAGMSCGKKITLFRILQEQLKNIIRHSQAHHIVIRLCCGRRRIKLSIQDDGKGFDATKKKPGIGLSNISDRVRLYNGTTKLQTAPGKGCLLEVSLPAEG